jgi:NADPH-dependent glutamate synthase beta subunit-like oxidoreductase/Pyruvate/2-oxoacid:ferredoxin oxidoreductase delta subunit
VGGGPAGLACAYHLARLGYPVELYEAEGELGGLLRHGIPGYRLPRAVLHGEIRLALAAGIEVRTGRSLGASLTWADLGQARAVFLATGAARPLQLGLPGEETPGVENGLDVLRRVNQGERPALGPRAVVVGGGSTAMDVARSARRLGVGSVTVVALEARGDMPAAPDEILQAEAEGVRITHGVAVVGFVELAGRLTGAVLAGATLTRGADGSVRPVVGRGRRWVLDADTVLLAIGLRPDLTGLGPLATAAGGVIAVDEHGRTSERTLFAGGDVASLQQRTVAHAVGAGTRAARRIHALLSGEAPPAAALPHAGAEARLDHVVDVAELMLDHFPRIPRASPRLRPPAERLASFAEVAQGLDALAAHAELARCFTCGHCVGCDTCFLVCPDMAVRVEDGGYRVALEHCKGCGLCVAECPRGAVQLVSER